MLFSGNTPKVKPGLYYLRGKRKEGKKQGRKKGKEGSRKNGEERGK